MRGTVPFRQAFQKFALVQCITASSLHSNSPSSRKGSEGLSYYRGWNKYCTSRTQFPSECRVVLKIVVNPPAPPDFNVAGGCCAALGPCALLSLPPASWKINCTPGLTHSRDAQHPTLKLGGEGRGMLWQLGGMHE